MAAIKPSSEDSGTSKNEAEKSKQQPLDPFRAALQETADRWYGASKGEHISPSSISTKEPGTFVIDDVKKRLGLDVKTKNAKNTGGARRTKKGVNTAATSSPPARAHSPSNNKRLAICDGSDSAITAQTATQTPTPNRDKKITGMRLRKGGGGGEKGENMSSTTGLAGGAASTTKMASSLPKTRPGSGKDKQTIPSLLYSPHYRLLPQRKYQLVTIVALLSSYFAFLLGKNKGVQSPTAWARMAFIIVVSILVGVNIAGGKHFAAENQIKRERILFSFIDVMILVDLMGVFHLLGLHVATGVIVAFGAITLKNKLCTVDISRIEFK